MFFDIALLCYCILNTCLLFYLLNYWRERDKEIDELYDLYYELSSQNAKLLGSKVIKLDRNIF